MKINWYKLSILLIISMAAIGLVSCASEKPVTESPPATSAPEATPGWMEIELTDVATGETFKISDFKGTPILLESFAVWCPTCLAQQKEMKKLVDAEGEAIIHISLDTDPNEDEARVKEHIERNDLNWYFVVSPQELTNALIDEFGLRIVSAPTAPVILICEDQSTRFLGRGIKSADKLLSETAAGCN
ncbi:MAG: redoxin family protein [Dehalococcoidales bacterium]